MPEIPLRNVSGMKIDAMIVRTFITSLVRVFSAER